MASKISTSKSKPNAKRVKSVSLDNGLETSAPGVVDSHKQVSQSEMVEVLMKELRQIKANQTEIVKKPRSKYNKR